MLKPLLLVLFFFQSACSHKTRRHVTAEKKADSVYPRGVQSFKANSDLPFRFLFVDVLDSNNREGYFKFDKLESTNVATTTHKGGHPLNYLNISSPDPITMRLYFNPGDHEKTLNITLEIALIYEDPKAKGEMIQHPLEFENSDHALLCPKNDEDRKEYGECHYREQESTFEQFVLPLKDWPREAKGKLVTVSLVLTEGADDRTVLVATFVAEYKK